MSREPLLTDEKLYDVENQNLLVEDKKFEDRFVVYKKKERMEAQF
jgi:hypothetical protein